MDRLDGLLADPLSAASVSAIVLRAASLLVLSRLCMSASWYCANALLTLLTAASVVLSWVSQAAWTPANGETEEEEEGEAVGDAVGDAVGLAVADDVAIGLGLASVMVIVVTPFCTVAVTSAPVVPMRNTPAMTPDFALSNSSSSFSSI